MMTNFTKRLSLLLTAVVVVALSFSATAQTTVYFTEEFNGGLGIFTADAGNPVGAVWEHSASASADSAMGGTIAAMWYTGLGAINSPSAANGCAMFNSDAYFNAGGFAAPQVASITSSAINMSANNTVSIQFNNFARGFLADVPTLLDVSIDGGMTWINYPINPEVASNNINTGREDGFVLQDITAVAANQPDVRIRFTWSGDHYFWLIDDVQLVSSPLNNIAMGDFFYSPAAYAQPMSQIGTDTMGFWVEVSNIGATAQSNVKVVASVTDDQLNPIWSDSLTINTLPVGYTDSLLTLPNSFVPNSLSVGQYAVTYRISSDSTDFDTSDNFDGDFFLVTDSTYSMHNNTDNAIRPGSGGDYMLGAVYRTSGGFNAGEYLATNFMFSAATNAADGALDGKTTTIWLVEVNDTVDAGFDNFDGSLDINNNPNLKIVGFNTYIYPTGSANFAEFRGQLSDLATGTIGVPLKPNTSYFILADNAGGNNVIFTGTNSGGFDYFQIATILYSSSWFFGGFGEDEAVTMELDIRNVPPSNTTKVTVLENATLNVYPNPATSFVNLDIAFEETAEAFLFITDATGRLVRTQDLGNILNERVRVDVSNLAAGTYFAKVSTNEGVLTKRFVVFK